MEVIPNEDGSSTVKCHVEFILDSGLVVRNMDGSLFTIPVGGSLKSALTEKLKAEEEANSPSRDTPIVDLGKLVDIDVEQE